MNWDAIGSIGEIIGAIAVVASLLYLSVQIRTSNRAARNALVQELQDTTKTVLHKDFDEAELFLKGLRDFNSLSEEDQFKFRCLFEVSIIDHARVYHLKKQGEIDDWITYPWDFTLNNLTGSPGIKQWYEQVGKNMMDPEFRSHFVKLMDRNSGNPITWIEQEIQSDE